MYGDSQALEAPSRAIVAPLWHQSYTVTEKLLEDLSFNAPGMNGREVTIDAKTVRDTLAEICQDQDLSKFIL